MTTQGRFSTTLSHASGAQAPPSAESALPFGGARAAITAGKGVLTGIVAKLTPSAVLFPEKVGESSEGWAPSLPPMERHD